MQNNFMKHLSLAALFLALGLLLPFLTGQIPQIGNMLLPMHLPVLLCGLICGWKYGGAVGITLPILRFFLFGMPPIFPTGVAMAFELATYGIVIGLLYSRLPQRVSSVYLSLGAAMVAGRVVWGLVRVLLSGAAGSAFTWELFMSGAFFSAAPGIILQLMLIPAIMYSLKRMGVLGYESAAAAGTTTR